MAGMRGMQGLKPLKGLEPIQTLDDVARQEDKRLKSWEKSVGPERAAEAMQLAKQRPRRTEHYRSCWRRFGYKGGW